MITMGFVSSVKRFYSNITSIAGISSGRGVVASRQITSDIVKFLIELSDYSNMTIDEIYEQMYVWEASVGGALDRISTFGAQSYQGCYLKDVGDELDQLEKDCLDDAKTIEEEICIRDYIEAMFELLVMKGMVYIAPEDYSLTILPNSSVTLLDDLSRKSNTDTLTEITKINYLIVDEGEESEKIYSRDQFRIIRYKNTPIHFTDNKGRKTFGVYITSPLHRSVLPIWWKRQTMIIDIMWRYNNIPRTHHKLSSEMFTLDKYSGSSIEERKAKANSDAAAAVERYTTSVKDKSPDQGYVSTDNIGIDIVEPKSAGYMETNKLIDQLSDQVYMSLNVPKSIVSGESNGSYASELIVSNYVSGKIIRIVEKFKPVLLEVMRARLRAINPMYPVDKLDMKFELVMTNSNLDLYKILAIMGALGLFTETEMREVVGFDRLREDQREYVVNTKTASSGVINSSDSTDNPETPQSSSQHPSDAGDAAVNRAERV